MVKEFFISSDETAILEKLELNWDDSKGYYLSALYKLETSEGIYELTIPYINLSVVEFMPPSIRTVFPNSIDEPKAKTIDIGFGSARLYTDDKNHYYHLKKIEKKTKKMTLKEIEEKLGHKVEIISE